MSQTKQCPYCGSDIPVLATRCKYCREWLPKDEKEKTKEVPTKEVPTKEAESVEIPEPQTPECPQDERLREEVARRLTQENGFLKAVDYYSRQTGVSEGAARKYVDSLNGIIRSWWPKGDIRFSCPHCNAIIRLGETFCQKCGESVEVTLPKEKKPEVKDRTGVKAKQSRGSIVVIVIAFFIIKFIVRYCD